MRIKRTPALVWGWVWGNSRRAEGPEDVETDGKQINGLRSKRIAGIPNAAFRGCWFIRLSASTPFPRLLPHSPAETFTTWWAIAIMQGGGDTVTR
jgi:hypothetical protein